jgi:hypothetical protein
MSRHAPLGEAIDAKGKAYGWRCSSGKHVWTDRGDAAKCCSPQWERLLAVTPTPADGVDAAFRHYWSRKERPISGTRPGGQVRPGT